MYVFDDIINAQQQQKGKNKMIDTAPIFNMDSIAGNLAVWDIVKKYIFIGGLQDGDWIEIQQELELLSRGDFKEANKRWVTDSIWNYLKK